MSDPTYEPLLDAALALRATSPDAWARFLDVLDGHALYAADAMRLASPVMLPVAQGQAQALRNHYVLLSTAAEKKQLLVDQRKTKR